jgi:L-ascorbate metabolism protein UlaG (beta-lactamase superfamily)
LIITHHTNSFLSVKSGSFRFVSDPWSGEANYGGWRPLPELANPELIDILDDTKLLYISHLHSDHFCPHVLKLIKNKDLTIVIKDFKSKRLLNNIKELGFENVLELVAWEPKKFGPFEITIIPQGLTNSDDLEDDLDYDLDTSVLIYDTESKTVFFHLVDNSFSEMQLYDISKFSISRYAKSLDIATLTCGAASEWPQCFPQLDRRKSKELYLKTQLNAFKKDIEALNVKWIMTGGGRYCIGGRFHGLNRYIAIPSNDELKKFIPNGSFLLDIEGGGSVEFLKSDGNETCTSPKINSVKEPSLSEDDAILLNKHKYNYEEYFEEDHNKFLECFKITKQRWNNKINELGIKPVHSIFFKIYNRLPIDSFGDFNSKDGLCYNDETDLLCLYDNDTTNARHVIHIEKQALLSCMKHRFILKQVLSGSLAIQFREPDTFDVAANFSLAFFGHPPCDI